jgi:D-alanine-D-alanine ligase
MTALKVKKNIAIAAGGDSGERTISLGSAAVISKHIDTKRYNAYVILISKEKWVYVPDKGKEVAVDKNDFSIRVNNRKIKFDAVFMAIHGTPGEDGKLPAYFDLIGMPYTCCDPVTSALTFNKGFCNRVVSHIGVKTARSMHLFKGHISEPARILKEVKLPLFVKPNNGGSSVGMSKVNVKEKLAAAIRKALKEDDEVLIEEFIKGTELTCGVFKYKGALTVLPITEIVPKTEYFDYVAKYKGKSEEITPARIPEEASLRVQSTSALLYEKLNCKGVIRIDYILAKDGLYFLEANTVPGLSEASIIPQQAQVYGYTIQEFFTMLIEDALGRK